GAALPRFALLAPEAFGHGFVGEISDVADHACHREPMYRHNTVFVVIAPMKLGVVDDGAAGDFVEPDVLRGQPGSAGNHDTVAQALRTGDRPTEGLHAAQGTTHDRS